MSMGRCPAARGTSPIGVCLVARVVGSALGRAFPFLFGDGTTLTYLGRQRGTACAIALQESTLRACRRFAESRLGLVG